MQNPKLPVSLSMRRIAEVLSKARENLRLSYRQLAAISGVSGASIARIEAGLGEHSVSKFFRLCLALGVPASDLLAYAIVNTVPMQRAALTAHPDIESAIEWAQYFEDIPAPESREKLSRIATYLYRLLVETLCGARPTVGLIGQHTRSEKLNLRLESLQITLDGFSNSERLATLETLLHDPWAKLKSLGLLTPEIMQELLPQKGPLVLFRYEIPESIENILFRQEEHRVVASARISANTSPPPAAPPEKESSKQVLTCITPQSNVAPMQSEILKVIQRLRKATAPRGKKAELARFMDVDPPRVSEWLSNSKKPSGETTLRLLHWVEQQERQQNKGSGSVDPRPEPKTQSKASNEKKPKSGRKKQ